MPTTAFLIDDDADDIDVLKEAITGTDPTVSCLSFIFADEAIDLLKTNSVPPPGYIFVDINMPRMSGGECLIELRKLEVLASTTIVMLSTSMPLFASERLLKAGANFAFQKPYSLIDYQKILSQIFSRDLPMYKVRQPLF